MASAEAPLELWQLAARAAQDETLREAVLASNSFVRLREDLRSTPAGRTFLENWDAFMARHGHRASGEVDLAAPRWSESPDELLASVRHYLRHSGNNDPLGRFADRSRERDRQLAESRARLKGPFRRWMLDLLVREAQAGLVFRENLKGELVRAVAFLRRLLLELGERLARTSVLEQREDIFFLTLEELEPVVSRRATFDVRSAVNTRRARHRANEALSPPPVIVDALSPEWRPPPAFDPSATVLSGVPVSPGKAVGLARVILSAASAESVLPGEILVAPYTDPAWTPHFLSAAGLVTDLGGQLSHGSVVAREYGLPAVVNVPFATRTLRTGQRICVDGDRGQVTILTPAL
jgi:pyruvate,water dikinase